MSSRASLYSIAYQPFASPYNSILASRNFSSRSRSSRLSSPFIHPTPSSGLPQSFPVYATVHPAPQPSMTISTHLTTTATSTSTLISISPTRTSKGLRPSSSEQSADVHQATAIPTLADRDRSQSSHSGRRLRFSESDQSRERSAESDRTSARGTQGNVHQFHRPGTTDGRRTNGEQHAHGLEMGVVRETVVPNRLLMARRIVSTAGAAARRRGSSSGSLDRQRVLNAMRLVGLTVLSGVFALCLAFMLYFNPPYPPRPIASGASSSHNHSHHHRHHHSRHPQHPPIRPSTPP